MFVNGFNHSVKIIQFMPTVSEKILSMDFDFTILLMIMFSSNMEFKIRIIDKVFSMLFKILEETFYKNVRVIEIPN
jgi:hypothetical protein